MTQSMSEADVRVFRNELVQLSPADQVQELESCTPDEQVRILASFSQAEKDRFLKSLPLRERVKHKALIEGPPSGHVSYEQSYHSNLNYGQHQQGVEPPQMAHARLIDAEPIDEKLDVKDDEPYDFIIYKGRLQSYHVQFVREITPLIWVCKVVMTDDEDEEDGKIKLTNMREGAEVLVNTSDIVNLRKSDKDKIRKFRESLSKHQEPQILRVGSWSIRCTGEFQNQKVFFPELLERFERLAGFILKSKCDIVALQEFPLKAHTSIADNKKFGLPADQLLPELIRKLDKVSKCGEEGIWDFGYSEDFPQEWTYEHRTIKSWEKDDEKVIDEYQSSNGKYIHAFIFKKNKIKMHSVEQVLDLAYQENRFKHAPSLGRFTFMERFHFSLCNVHLRPEDTNPKRDSRYEIEDLGKCVEKMRTYNPDSTIILGDFNMSATPYAPDKAQTDKRKLTKFEPICGNNNVWDSFYAKDYTPAVKNRYTNAAETKQFDNIWLPKALDERKLVEETPEHVDNNKENFYRTENVLRLQDIFVGGGGNRDLINAITDHQLVFVDLNIDLSKDNTFIKKVFEIDNSIQDLPPREFNGFDENERKKKEEKDRKTNQVIESEITASEPTASESNTSDAKPVGDGVRPVGDGVSASGGGERNANEGSGIARAHAKLWFTLGEEDKITTEDMGGQGNWQHWITSLFPKHFKIPKEGESEEKRRAYLQMKDLESRYFECDRQIKVIEARVEELKKLGAKQEINNIRKTRRDLLAEIDFDMDNDGIFPEFEQLAHANFIEYVTKTKASPVKKQLFKGGK